MKFDDPILNVLERKGWAVYSVSPTTTVYDALREMSRRDVGSLAVMDGARLVGILSERDYSRKVILLGRSSMDTSVEEVMSPAASVLPSDSVDHCLHLMASARLRHLTVVDRGEVVGVVSIGDLVNWVISAQAATIDHLHHYIAADYPA